MVIGIDNISMPNDKINSIGLRMTFYDISGADDAQVHIFLDLPPDDVQLSEIRQNALTNAKCILAELLKQLET